MKAALILCCLALFVALHAADYVCDRDGNNMPDCTNSTYQGLKIRNFWDPTRYWSCNSSNVAESIACEIHNADGTMTTRGFLAPVGDCVPWSQWYYTEPCQ